MVSNHQQKDLEIVTLFFCKSRINPQINHFMIHKVLKMTGLHSYSASEKVQVMDCAYKAIFTH